MQLFSLDGEKVMGLSPISFKKERNLQQLFEANLEVLTGWEFVCSEFSIKDKRFDTVAYDRSTKSFVIIEFKNITNRSVVDQGITYLGMMLEYKAEFVMEYNERSETPLKRQDVDWTQSRVLFVAPSFTDFQQQAANFKDLPIDLWEVKQYDKGLLLVNPLKKSKSAPKIKEVQVDPTSDIAKVAKEIVVYTEDDHLNGKSDAVLTLYEQYKLAIQSLDPAIEIVPTKQYIAFKKERNLVDIVVMKSGLKFWINKKSGGLDDPKHIARDVSAIGHWGNGDYEVVVNDTSNLEYILFLIKQTIL